MRSEKKLGSLRLLVSLLAGAILLAFALTFFSIFHSTMPAMLQESERKYLSRQITFVDGLLESARENVALLTEDTAIWDETYRYAKGDNPEYFTANWPDKSLLESFRLNFIIIKDAAGNDLHIEFHNLRTRENMPAPAGFSAHLAKLAEEVRSSYAANPEAALAGGAFGREGVVLFHDTAYDVAAKPIVPFKGAPEPSGTLLMGYILDNDYFQQLTRFTTSAFAVRRDTEDGANTGDLIRLEQQGMVSIHTRLTAADGTPLALTMTEPRLIYAEGRAMLDRAYYMLLAAMAMFGIVLYFTVTRLLTGPIARLSSDIQQIAASKDAGSAAIDTAKYSRASEFVILCSSINSMLQNLSQSRISKDQAEQSSVAKSEFLSRMSHEMRTPLNAIIGMTTIAASANDPEKKQYCLDKIGDASQHLLGVINDILDMSKIEANKFELSHEEFVFEKMLLRVCSVMNFSIEEKKLHFTVTVDPGIPRSIVADEQRLAQVIANLLSNAVKFTPEYGSISLSARQIAEDDDSCTLRIDVTDSGIGVPPEHQDKLFKSFEQADGGISRKFGGTGLGLAISRRIVEMMGGEIWIESEPGKGARFAFTLRARRGGGIGDDAPGATPDARGRTPAAPPASFAGRTILLAEDIAINREIVITLLEDTGITIDCAENGAMACAMFAANPAAYDMIFMDIHMPDVDGYEATRRIRAMSGIPEAATVPIIAMTANVFREDIARCLEAGMNGHIGKPINLEEIFQALRDHCP